MKDIGELLPGQLGHHVLRISRLKSLKGEVMWAKPAMPMGKNQVYRQHDNGPTSLGQLVESTRA